MALFGSYDWGDGEWMRKWEERMKEAGAEVVGTVIANNERGDDDQANLAELAEKAGIDKETKGRPERALLSS